MQPTQRLNGNAVMAVSLELADKSWKVALTDQQRAHPAVFKVDQAGLWDRLEALLHRLQEFKRRWKLPAQCHVLVLYEAGQDGFWIARALQARGVQEVVIDAASVPVPRHARRAKTDRLDALKLLGELQAWLRGERPELRVVHIPSEDAEARRLLTRQRGLLQKEIGQHRDRMRKLLRTQGCKEEMDVGFVERLVAGQVRRGDGRPIPEELWRGLGQEESITLASWPAHDEALCVDDSVEVPLQVNGKVRGRVVLAKDATEEDARAAALADRGVQTSLEGKKIVKMIYVPGRILNLVVK